MGMNNEISVQEYARTKGIGANSVRIALVVRKGRPDLWNGVDGTLSSEAVEVLGTRTRKQPRPKQSPTPQPIDAPATTPAIQAEIAPKFDYCAWVTNPQRLLDVVNAFEIIMVLCGCVVQMSYKGLVPGIPVCAFYVYTALSVRNPDTSNLQKEIGLSVCGVLTAVFMFLHGQTFWYWFDANPALQMYFANGAATLISCISFTALVQSTKNQ